MAFRRRAPVLALLAYAAAARADRVDDLSRALLEDSSYKVRVQAALVLGRLKDPRGAPALSRALKDDNETVRGVAALSLGQLGDRQAVPLLEDAARDRSVFVRDQATRALSLLGAAAPARAGAHFFLAIGFQGGGKSSEQYALVRQALTSELAKLPSVTLSVGAGAPSAKALAERKLQGYFVDGSIARLTAAIAGGGAQIECDLKAFVATYPERSIKMMTTEGASLQTGVRDADNAKRDCLLAAAQALRDDVGKFLQTLE